MSKSSLIGVVILNYGKPTLTIHLAEQVLKIGGMRLKVVLVDNYSSDEAAVALSDHFKSQTECGEIDILCLPTNRGYGPGNNSGLSHIFKDSRVTAALVLNPDVDLLSFDADNLLSAIEARHERLLFTGDVFERNNNVSIQRFQPLTLKTRPIKASKSEYSGASPYIIPGCAWGINRRMWEEFGCFANDYFLYFEELDFVFRYKNKYNTFPTVIKTKHFILHHQIGGVTGISRDSQKRSVGSDFWSARSRILFCRRNLWYLLPIAILYNAVLVSLRIFRGQFRHAEHVYRGSLSAFKGG